MHTVVRLVMILIASTGCPKAPSALGDPTLPEAVEAVDAQTPQALLASASESLDPAVRARALHLLVLSSDDLTGWGARALFDPSPWVQRAALRALSTRPEAGAPLLRGYVERDNTDPTARSLAALQLPRGSVDLADAWAQVAAPWDRLPLALAAWHHGDDDARAAVEATLRTGELPLDLDLMDALALHGDASLLPALADAQDRVEPELATALAAVRIRLGDPKAEVELRRSLGGDVYERMEVLDRIATWDDPAADALIRKASSAGPDLARSYGELLLTARTGQHTQRLSEALQSVDRDVRLLGVEAAAQALSHGPADRALARGAMEVLREATADPDPAVRSSAARALGEHGGPDHADLLQAMLADEVQQVRIEAAGALLR